MTYGSLVSRGQKQETAGARSEVEIEDGSGLGKCSAQR